MGKTFVFNNTAVKMDEEQMNIDGTCVEELDCKSEDETSVKDRVASSNHRNSGAQNVAQFPNLNRNCQQRYHNVILRHFESLVDGMMYINKVIYKLSKYDILDDTTTEYILNVSENEGSRKAADVLLMKMSADHNPEHLEIFLQVLEETGQQTLARMLRESPQVLDVCLKIQHEGTTLPTQEMTDEINGDPNRFLDEVFAVEAYNPCASEGCIQITLVVKNQFELQKLQKNIQCGLVTQRFRLWLSKHGYDITEETKFYMTLTIAEQGEKQNEPIAIHAENATPPLVMEDSSKEANAEKDQNGRTFEMAQSGHETELWQETVADHSSFISEILKDLDTLVKDLADEQDKACQNMLKYAEVEILSLLKLVINKSQKFLTFVRDTGQREILGNIPEVSPERETSFRDRLGYPDPYKRKNKMQRKHQPGLRSHLT